MKISCERENFLHAFQTTATVAPTRSPKAILQNVKMDVTANDTAVLTATDMEVGIRVNVSGIEASTTGAVLLPVQRFASILRESSDEKLTLEVETSGTTVRGERSEFKLPAANPAEFPAVATFEESRFHELPARLFRELIRRTLFATETDSSRYALGGVLLELEDDKIVAVGTDGRRLAKMEGPAHSVEGHSTGDATTIVPKMAMQLIERALSDNDAEIQLAARGNDILVRSPRATIYSRLLEGRFPKWRDVLPDRQDGAKLELTVGPMLAALRQASIVASDDSRGIDFSFADGSLVLSGLTAELGQSRVELPIAYDGEPITVTLDHRFVGEFLKVLDPEKTFTLDVVNGESAALFSTEDGYAYVVMPLSRD